MPSEDDAAADGARGEEGGEDHPPASPASSADGVKERVSSLTLRCDDDDEGDDGDGEAEAKAEEEAEEEEDAIPGVRFVDYRDESQLGAVMRLVGKDLSEPYSVFTYRYFLHRFPDLCILAVPDNGTDNDDNNDGEGKDAEPVGCVVCKIDEEEEEDDDAGGGGGGGAPGVATGAATAGDDAAASMDAEMEDVPHPRSTSSSSAASSGRDAEATGAGKEPSPVGDGGGDNRGGDEGSGADAQASQQRPPPDPSSPLPPPPHRRPPGSPARKSGYMAMLAVDMSHRHRGIGTALVRRVVRRMRRRGCSSVTLETEVSNDAAMRLYEERLGFVREELLVRYYLNWGDAYRLRLWFD